MTQKEAKRVPIIERAIRNEITQKRAGDLMAISYRQSKRLIKQYKENGLGGIVHKKRGCPSNRKLSDQKVKMLIDLYKTTYSDFGPTLFQEKLRERHDIQLGVETIRQLLIQHGCWLIRQKRNKPLYVWRERRGSEGELIQIDGSHHRWLEDRLDQEFCLMGYIDDATNTIYGRFYEYEGIYPVFDSFKRYIAMKGCPEAVYIDRHSTYKTTRKASIDEELAGTKALTQFERVMNELNITVIHARSPQAKGRIERLFKTLQDRLVKEMRLANICTIKEANVFLENYLIDHNERFSVKPKNAKSMWQPLPQIYDIQWTFSKRYTRTILNDYTIQWNNQRFLINNPYLALQGQKVDIRQAVDGTLQFKTKHKTLTLKAVSALPERPKPMSMTEAKRKLHQALGSHAKSKKSWMDDLHFGQTKTDTKRLNTLSSPVSK